MPHLSCMKNDVQVMDILALFLVKTLMLIWTWLNLAGALFLTLTVMLCLVLLGKVFLLEVQR